MSDGSAHSLAYSAETVYGVTNANPVFKYLRHNSTNLALTKDTKVSAEIRPDRQIGSVRHGMRKVAGASPFDFCFGSFDDLIEAAFCGTWATGVPAVGTDELTPGTTRRSFTIERNYTDIASVDKPYYRYTGCEVGSLSLSVKADSIVTGEVSFVGKDLNLASTAIVGASYADAYTVMYTEPFDTFTGTLKEGGVTIGTVTEFSFKLENGISPRSVVGSNVTARPSIGKSNVTGSLTIFFENSVHVEKFLNEVESSLELNMTDIHGNAETIIIPALKYTGGGSPEVGGEGPVTLALPFQATLDPVTGTNIIFRRTPV